MDSLHGPSSAEGDCGVVDRVCIPGWDSLSFHVLPSQSGGRRRQNSGWGGEEKVRSNCRVRHACVNDCKTLSSPAQNSDNWSISRC